MKQFFVTVIAIISLLSSNSYSQSGWTIQSSGTFENLNSIKFIDVNTGWVVGNLGVVLKTTNGGNNWTAINTGFNGNNFSVQIFSANTIVIGSDNSQYIFTTNAGTSWIRQIGTPISGSGNRDLSNIVFANSLTGYSIVRSSTYITYTSRSTNGGASWEYAFTLGSDTKGMYFYPATVKGWMVGKSIYPSDYNFTYTSDGLNWNTLQIGDTTSLNAVHFITTTQGMIVGNRGKVYKTINGGVNWSSQNSNSIINLNDVISSNINQTWTIGDGGVILNTTNGGISWSSQLSPTTQSLNSIYFPFNSNTGWVCGNQGIILKTINGGVGIQQISSEVPDKFSLSQNYPNPFNPSTKIRFNISKSGFVRLKIFDAIGREVRQLVNENLSSGIFEIDFDATELPSGVYYYKLETNGYAETKKMTLLK